MSRRGWMAGVALALLIVLALWSSSLIIGAPALQATTTDQQTVDALVQQRSQQTATAQQLSATPTSAAQQATRTAAVEATINAALVMTSTEVGHITHIEDAALSANGVFNAYFLAVTDGIGAQMTTLRQTLSTRFDWNIQDLSLADLTSSSSALNQNDPVVTGQVIVIPGGSVPLTAAELKALQAYVAKGGDLVILAGTNLNNQKQSLATADDLNTWLYQDFGMRFNNDVVLDQTQAFQSPLVPVSTDLDGASFITTNGITSGQAALVFEAPNSITVTDAEPLNILVRALARSTDKAYAKTNLQDVIDNKIDQATGDATGPFVLAAAAENTQTHAHVILLGSTALGDDRYATFQNIDNLSVVFNSLVWATEFDEYFTVKIAQQQTVAALVQQRFDQTAQAPGSDASNQTATANVEATVNAAIGQAILATARAQRTAVATVPPTPAASPTLVPLGRLVATPTQGAGGS